MRFLTEAEEEQYEHNLVVVLKALKVMDIDQFLRDLRFNQPNTFEKIRSILLGTESP